MRLNNKCTAIGPSDQACIGRFEFHEVHCDRVGTTWRDYAGKRSGVFARSVRTSSDSEKSTG